MTRLPMIAAAKAMLDALHAALDEADEMVADGYPEPEWAAQARAAVIMAQEAQE